MQMQTDIAAWTAPLDDAAPSGPDLEYDADFMALERAVAPRGERIVGDGGDADGPDWERLLPSAVALLERSRDLRVAVTLCSAWLDQRGLPGWRDGLALVHGLLDTLWDTVHPQLDADDDDDPTARVNALLPLADPLGPLGRLRTTAFVRSPRLGAFALRELRIAAGTLKPADPDAVLPTMSEIEACCLDCPEDLLSANAAAAHEALAHARAIDGLLSERLSTQAPELRPLLSDLFELDRFLQAQWHARIGTADTAGTDADGAGAGSDDAAPRPVSASGGIAGPADVVRRIDELCEYYARQEPSSPVPILLRRARRLVGKGFEELLRDIAPAGLSELQYVVGPSEEG
ncbi:type VI secretion system protein TssA [Luteimonas sp. BDR2-5]|uniref:type VI secretion system protein TssA n=1 Tax=Proluteimonas luteida TaxID=2878685 RepID=UPI001E523FB1|nr:type VI secretion system protein TssA [Luteimonas sp. BDR2-5]MCD9027883.1 type VI secretion system protein TssA [Luteimonas sp. BDR2-5]